MIQELIIRNYALIDQLKVEFAPGLNILTGETGAGKSIVLEAIGLVLGERGSPDLVKSGCSQAVVEAAIDIAENPAISDLISDLGFVAEADEADEADSETLILERQISANGKSRCHINGRLATLSALKDIGDLLVDIHGQHEHQSLFRVEKHLDLLDNFGKLNSLREKVSEKYSRIERLQKELEQLEADYKEKLRQKELFEFQFNELRQADLKAGEEEELISERKVLNNAETLYETAVSAYEKILGSESSDISILDLLRGISNEFSKLTEIDKSLVEVASRIGSALYELEDISASIRSYADSIEFEPNRLEQIETRLDLIYKLKRKYGDSITEIINYKKRLERDLELLSVNSTKIEDIKVQLNRELEAAKALAFELSTERQKVAKRLELAMEKELETLGMAKTRFKVLMSQKESENGIIKSDSNSKRFELAINGIDQAEFLIAPNVGEPLKPLAKIASGGEISRIMLALKTVLASSDQLPTLIFDEIDAGIGGHTAEVVGKKLKELSKLHQVICITHLPQIASLAEAHYLIRKRVVGDKTKVEAAHLDKEARVQELARMLGGKKITQIALAHAKELAKASKN